MKKVMILAAFLMMGSACDIGGLNLGRDGKAVSSLSEADQQAACEDIEAYYESEIPEAEQKRAACTLAGAFAAAFSSPTTDAELQMACATARDECINSNETSEEEGEDSCAFDNIPDDCEATIGEVELCYEEQIEQTKQAFAELDCANLTLDEMEALGLRAISALPHAFREQLGDVVFAVEDFADAETLRDLGIEDPFELSGVYEGHALTERSIEMSGQLPTRIRLFRRPILDEWAERGAETLEHLVLHVVIHEIGHHFGLSDEDMHALEDLADQPD